MDARARARRPQALQGANRTFRRDLPVFTTEVTVHHFPARTRELLELIDSLGYDSEERATHRRATTRHV